MSKKMLKNKKGSAGMWALIIGGVMVVVILLFNFGIINIGKKATDSFSTTLDDLKGCDYESLSFILKQSVYDLCNKDKELFNSREIDLDMWGIYLKLDAASGDRLEALTKPDAFFNEYEQLVCLRFASLKQDPATPTMEVIKEELFEKSTSNNLMTLTMNKDIKETFSGFKVSCKKEA